MKTQKDIRLLPRDLEFHQSSGKLNISSTSYSKGWMVFVHDWFHSLIELSTIKIILLIILTYIFSFIIYGTAYYLISIINNCPFNITTLIAGMLFAVETLFTIGYDAPDHVYSVCPGAISLLYIVIMSNIFLVSLIGVLLITRISRAQTRASTIVFSDQAVIRRIRGRLYFLFRVCEIRKHQMYEIKIRCYCIRNDIKTNSLFQTFPMRLINPDDQLGGMLMLSFPCTIVHTIDNWSPLRPYDDNNNNMMNSYQWPRLIEREDDIYDGMRLGYLCKICGETFHNQYQYDIHTHYSITDDKISGHDINNSCKYCGETFSSIILYEQHLKYFPKHDNNKKISQNNHSSLNHLKFNKKLNKNSNDERFYESEEEMKERIIISNYLKRSSCEILVLLEGVDSLSGSSVQARHSYTSDDIEWNKTFDNCFYSNNNNNKDEHQIKNSNIACLEFDRFHSLIKAPMNCDNMEEYSIL